MNIFKIILPLVIITNTLLANTVNIETFLSERKDTITSQILSINEKDLTSQKIIIKDINLNLLFTKKCSFSFTRNEIVCGFIKVETSSIKDEID